MRSIFILTLCCLIIQLGESAEKFINYGMNQQGVVLFNFFYDVPNGFYVDIGAYDSIFASNTLNLQAMGWDGINIDASPSRLPRFFYSRPWEPSLNYAIGDEDQYVILYELAEDSSSTVSNRVKDFVASYKPVQNQVKVPSISMKQLCERFFYRRPLFLNLDIQGYGYVALASNDWKNPRCRPQIIFSELIEQMKYANLPYPQQILTKNGYKKWPQIVGLNQVYILSQLYSKYEQKYKKGNEMAQKKAILNIGTVAYNFVVTNLHLTTTVLPHYQPKSDDIYFYFAKYRQPVDLYRVNQFSNHLSVKQNRPIVLLSYDPADSVLLIRNGNYSAAVIDTPEMRVYNVTVFKEDLRNFSVYVMDLSIASNAPPRILITNISTPNQPQSIPKQPLNPTLSDLITKHQNETTTAKTLLRIEQLLNESTSLVNFTKKNTEFRFRELMSTILSNHFYDKGKFQDIQKKIGDFQRLNAQNGQIGQNGGNGVNIGGHDANGGGNTGRKVGEVEEIGEVQEGLEDIMTYQVIVLLTVFFAMLIVNVVICLASEPTSRKSRKSKNPPLQQKSPKNSAPAQQFQEQPQQPQQPQQP